MKSGCFYSGFFTIGFAALVLLAQAAPCFAGERIKALTEQNVKEFIEKTTDITTGNGDLSAKNIRAYLDKHLDKKARFKSVMKYHIPGMPSQETVLILNKEKFMQSVREGANSTQDYETLVEIQDMKISSNGKKAFVKTRNTEYTSMAVPTGTGGSEEVPMEGVSECTQILSLNKGVIQMYSANCVTNIQFMEY